MKKTLLFLLVFITALSVLLFTRYGDGSPSSESGAKNSAQNTGANLPQRQKSTPQAAKRNTTTRIIGGVSSQGKLVKGNPGAKPQPHLKPHPKPDIDDPFILKVLAEKWIDAPSKAGRRRVRIVKADFKYPNIRLEEEVWTDPKTGKETVNRLRASVADHVMVGLKPGADAAAAQKILVQNGYRIRAVEPGSYILAELPDFKSAEAQKKSITDIEALNEFIDYAEPDYIVYPSVTPNDPAFSNRKLWGLDNPGAVAGTVADADIDAPEGWDIRHDAPNVIVAITDTGIQYNHEDLAPNMWTNAQGYHGYDAYDDDNDPMDTGGHGTHVAGTIGARGDNGKGLTGVAWNVQLMAGRFLGPNGGSTSDGIKVINYARNNGANIISASWGGGGYSKGLYNAIKAAGDAGIPFVAAAGNSGTNNDSTPHYPSSYDLPTLVAVASTTSQDKLSYFSCYGRYSVDIAAPGSDIWSSYIGSNTSYKYLNGTSMATPHVSGALALARAHFPADDAEDLIARLYSSVDHTPALAGKVSTGGRLNLHKLLGASTAGVNNDDFENALRFEGVFGYWSGSNKKATREADEDSFSLAGTGNRSLWFAWKAPYKGLVEFTVEASEKPFRIIAFRGSEKGSLGIASDGGSVSDAATKTIRFYCQQDQEYRFLVDSSHATGQNLLVTMGLKAVNDPIAGALTLTGDRFSTKANSRNATAEAFETTTPHAGVGKGKSLWWKWTPDFDGDFVITTQGSEFDTVLAVYTGTPGSLTEVTSNDDRNAMDWTSQATFTAVAGTTYYIAVDGFRGDAAGNIVLNGFKRGVLTIIRQPKGATLSLGDHYVIHVSFADLKNTAFQWYRDGVALPGESTSSLVIDSMEEWHFGTYTLKASRGDQQITSHPATLIKKKKPPFIKWSSGDQVLPSGYDCVLKVIAGGDLPLTYQWYKDGVAIPSQNTDTLSLSPLIPTSNGLYEVKVTNSIGSVSGKMFVKQVDVLLNSWAWRLPHIPRHTITDIKTYSDIVYAVSGSSLMSSSDAVSWQREDFPYGFIGHSFEMIGSKRLCIGRNINRDIAVAVSEANGPWIVYTTPDLPSPKTSNYKLYSFKGKWIALDMTGYHSDPLDNSASLVYYSTDGLIWSRSQGTDLEGARTNLLVRGSIASDGQKMIMASTESSSNNRMRYYMTTDALNWQEMETQEGVTNGEPRNPKQCVYAMGKFFLIGHNCAYSSPSSENWTYHTYNKALNWRNEIVTIGTSTAAFGLPWNPSSVPGSPKASWFSSVENFAKIAGESISTLRKFTALAEFKGGVVYGTSYGNLKWVSTHRQMVHVRVPYKTMIDEGNLRSDGGTFTYHEWTSDDGKTWTHPITSRNLMTYHGYAGGLYWGRSRWKNTLVGRAPLVFGDGFSNGTPIPSGDIIEINETPDGSVLALTTNKLTEEKQMEIKRLNDDEFSLVTVTQPFDFNNLFKRAGDYLYSSKITNTKLLATSNGEDWIDCNLSGDLISITKNGDSYYAVISFVSDSDDTVVVKSGDGLNWSDVSQIGLPSGWGNSIREIVSYQGDLVAQMGSDIYSSKDDGVTWVRVSLPDQVESIAVHDDQLVVALKNNGAILQAGAPVAGNSAPVVKITSHDSFFQTTLGSKVTVKGVAYDPEDGDVSYSFSVDGKVINQGVGGDFICSFFVKTLGEHLAVVEVSDSQGLTRKSSFLIRTTLQNSGAVGEEDRKLSNISGSKTIGFNNLYYTHDGDYLYVSRDGLNWDLIMLPMISGKIVALTSGNGALMLQSEDGTLLSSKNGITWTATLKNALYVRCSSGYYPYVLSSTLKFQGGFFQVKVIMSEGYQGWATSVDAQTWNFPEESQPSLLCASPTGVFLIRNNQEILCRKNQTLAWNTVFNLPQNTTSIEMAVNYVGGQFLIFDHLNKKCYRSLDGETWNTVDLSASSWLSSSVKSLVFRGGKYFMKIGLKELTSTDGVTWDEISKEQAANHINIQEIGYYQSIYLTEGWNGLALSHDGLTWSSLDSTKPKPLSAQRIITNDNGFLVIDNAGCSWSSQDGESWIKLFQPSNLQPKAFQGFIQAKYFANYYLIAGSNGLRYSSDVTSANSWTPCLLNGQPVNENIEILLVTEHWALARGGEGALYRSDDAIHWTEVDNAPAFASIATNGTEYRGVSDDGKLYKSQDKGLVWTLHNNLGDVIARSISWFQGKWILIGTLDDSYGAQLHVFTIGQNEELEDRYASRMSGFNYKNLRHIQGFGKMIVWTQANKAYKSEDGINWSALHINFSDINAVSSMNLDVNESGFTAIGRSVNTSKSSYLSVNPANSPLWYASPVTIPYDVTKIESAGGVRFMFSLERMYISSDHDLALTLKTESESSLGVGDRFSVDVRINNLGEDTPVAGGWVIKAWLSQDSYIGDLDDIFLGEVPVVGALPGPQESNDYSLEYEIPELVSSGQHYVVLRLSNPASKPERNITNNTVISPRILVSIPEWELSLATNGNGQVNQDFAAVRYPHKARVSLTANAGKGAAFSGWGGDAIGGESQITILMDGNKSVQANFSSRASLQVHIRGAGEVTGLADLGSYTVGDTAALAAVAADGWVFSGWTGASTGNTPTTNILMDAPKAVTANFTQPISNWKTKNFTAAELLDSAISGDDADPDGDGLKNWQEYLHSSNPKDAASKGVISLKLEGDWLYAIFTRNTGAVAGVSLACQGTRDLSDWNAPDLQERILSTKNGIETIEARIPANGKQKGFLRLKYDRSTP